MQAPPFGKGNDMRYRIGQFAHMTGLSPHTLRYYDSQGLLPFLEKDEKGNRSFGERDLSWIQVLECRKVSGFTLSEMKEYADLVQQGDATLEQRLALFEGHRERAREKIEELQLSLDALNYKCWYYRTAVEAGTEQVLLGEGEYDQVACYRAFKQWESERTDQPDKPPTLYPYDEEPPQADEAKEGAASNPRIETHGETAS